MAESHMAQQAQAAEQQQQLGDEASAGPEPAAGLLGLPGDAFRAIWALLDKRSQQALRLACSGLRDAAKQVVCSLKLEQLRPEFDKVASFGRVGRLRDLQFTIGGIGITPAISFFGAVWKSKQAQSVLGDLQRIELLEVGKYSGSICDSVATLSPGLQALSMEDINHSLDLGSLSSLPDLRALALHGPGVDWAQDSLNSLSALTGLTHLSLRGMGQCKKLDMSAITMLHGLRSLELACLKRTNLPEVAQACTGLTHLALSSVPVPAAQLPLFPQLQSLSVGGCEIGDPQQQVQEIAGLTRLTKLIFEPACSSGAPALDLSALSALSGLRDLQLIVSSSVDTTGPGPGSFLSSCGQLTRLWLKVLSQDWAFDLQPLRSLRTLHLELSWTAAQVQAVVNRMEPLTTLTHLTVRKTLKKDYRDPECPLRFAHICGRSAEQNRADPSIDITPLASLVSLQDLELGLEEEWVCGLAALGPACSRLTHVFIECKGLGAAAAAGAGSTHDEGPASGSSNSYSASSVPVWASLEMIRFKQVTAFHAWHEPGAVADLQLHRAPVLATCEGFSCFSLERGGPESSAAALRAACDSLASVYNRTGSTCKSLSLTRCDFNEPLAAYIQATQPLADHAEAFHVRNPSEPTQQDREALQAALPKVPRDGPIWASIDHYDWSAA